MSRARDRARTAVVRSYVKPNELAVILRKGKDREQQDNEVLGEGVWQGCDI